MKKKIALFLAAVMAVTILAGCTTTAPVGAAPAPAAGGETAAAAEEAEKTFTIATVVKDAADPWFIRMEEGVQRFADESGYVCYQKGPSTTDSAQQVQILEELVAQGVDAICCIPVDPDAVEPVLKKAMDAGIVVITHESPAQNSTNYNLEAFENEEYGEYMMDLLAEACGEEGKYVTIVSFLTNATHNLWADAAIKRQKEAYPNMELVEEEKVEAESNQEKAYEKAKELLKKYPDLKGFIGTDSFDPVGVGMAIEEMGLAGQCFVVGSSIQSVADAQLENGTAYAVTCWDPADAGYAINKLAAMILEGREDEIVEGLDLGVTGFESIHIRDGKYINGQGWLAITKENKDQYQF